MAIFDSHPDLSYAERLAGMAEGARRRGQSRCAERLLLLAWTALDDAERAGPGAKAYRFLSRPPQA